MLSRFNIPCLHSIKVYFTSGKKASVLSSVQREEDSDWTVLLCYICCGHVVVFWTY